MLHEAIELSEQIKNSNTKGVNISVESFPLESHGSVYYPGLNSALRKHFKDYRQPDVAQILSPNFDHQALLNYFAKRAAKYQVESSKEQIQSAIFDAIFHSFKAKKFDQALALWPLWQSPYKMYNVNRLVSHFLRENDSASAITLLQKLQKLTKLEPASVVILDRLAGIYQQQQQDQQADNYRVKVQQLLTTIFSKSVSAQQEASLNQYAYSLLREQRNQEAISVFKRLTLANPLSINAFDSLAEAYETTNNYAEAIKAMEQTIVIVQSKEDIDAAPFQKILKRLKKHQNTESGGNNTAKEP